MNIGERIKQSRESLGITQQELADRMGYKSKATINKVELGINDITQTNIKKYSEVLGVSISYLMGWEDEERKYDYVDTDLIASIITSKSDMEFVKTYGKLNPENKSKVNDIAKALLFTQENH